MTAESCFAEDHSCTQWNKTDYPFPQIKQRMRELREKLTKLWNKVNLPYCSTALEMPKLNWFMIHIEDLFC